MARRDLEITIPPFFTCPISLDLMKDPVSTCTGVTYDRASIEKWIDDGNNTCPATLQPLLTTELIPNHTLRRLIQAWCGANSAKGVERIPTPKTPANSQTVTCLFREIQLGGANRLLALHKLRGLARDSVRNAICISDEGGAHVLAGVLRGGCENGIEDKTACEESVGILSVLPLDDSAKKKLGDVHVLAAVAFLLRGGVPDARISSAELVERLAADEQILSLLTTVDGLIAGLVDLLRDVSHTRAVRAAVRALGVACALPRNRLEAVAAGAVDGLVAILIEQEKGLDEGCLSLMELLCRCAEGRAAVAEHALAVPVMAKKMSRSSPVAAERAVMALWSLCSHCQSEEFLRYAAESGMCSKLFWLLQVDCTHKAKIKAGDLIRLIHVTVKDCPCCYANACFDNAGLLGLAED